MLASSFEAERRLRAAPAAATSLAIGGTLLCEAKGATGGLSAGLAASLFDWMWREAKYVFNSFSG
jgi:hypothetical protein